MTDTGFVLLVLCYYVDFNNSTPTGRHTFVIAFDYKHAGDSYYDRP